MSPTTRQSLLKMNGNYRSDMHKLHAVALAERSAAFVSFRWHQPSLPPTQNFHSAVAPVLAAVNSAGIMQFVQQMQ